MSKSYETPQDKFEAAEIQRLQAEIPRLRAQVQQAERQAQEVGRTAGAVGRGIGSANTGNRKVDFGLAALGKAVESFSSSIGHVWSDVEAQKLKMSQAEGQHAFYTRKK